MNINGKICRNCGASLLVKNRYKAINILGRGGFARTFELVDEQSTKKVLKVLNLSRFADSNRKEIVVNLFEREAEVLSRLKHPGIPKVEPDGYFQLTFTDCEEPLYCLMMEKIDGLNLQQWLVDQRYKTLTFVQARTWLKQLVEILEQVHQKNYFHRDIKPANIMLKPDEQLVLIDFGAVKDLAETFLQQEDTFIEDTPIGSRGYAPPEQMKGKATTQSDFFALARTFVHLLTGIHPLDLEDQRTGRLIWRDKVSQISNQKFDFVSRWKWQFFCNLLDEMMEESSKNRPQNTQVILQRLNKKFFIPRTAILTAIGAILVLVSLISSYWYFTGVNGCTKIFLRKFPIGDNMSCGEEIMMTNSSVLEKQEGVNAFHADNYSLAVKFFEKAWQKQHDPETLIYLNNARLAAENIKAYTIAIVAPIGDNNNDSINFSKFILQGIAQAQNDFNKEHKQIGLKVVISSDNNSPENAVTIAHALGQKSDILAVIGHFRSDTTIAAIQAYEQYDLLLISPTATSEDLSKICKSEHPYCFFRVVDSNRVTAKALTRYLKKVNKHRAAIFYNPDKNYSVSLKKEIKEKFSQLGGKVVVEIPFSDDLESTLNKVEENNADVIVLLPTTDGLTSDATLQVIDYAKESKYLIVGGDSLENPKIIGEIAGNETGSVVAIPWYHDQTPLNQKFVSEAEKLWGKTTIYWHTALTYDATRVLLTALEQLSSPNRVNLHKAIASPNFTATGVTGKISFAKNGDRQDHDVHLVQIKKNRKGQTVFISVK